MSKRGIFVGYDPGGNGTHGVAAVRVSDEIVEDASVQTLDTAEEVVSWIEGTNNLLGIGVDTLAYWSTGPSGWRGADLWLRQNYPEIRNSIACPNGLRGSMGLNGMAVLSLLRKMNPQLPVSETHPKVLYWALTGRRYNYDESAGDMDAALSRWIDFSIQTNNDHEWDASVSALAAFQGSIGRWNHDLHADEELACKDRRLVHPAGPVNYWWPE